MPTYEYRCPQGHLFERFQKISDKPEAECPTCGEQAERLISGGAGFLFKGGGFYSTDYRSDSYKKAVSAENSEAASKGGDGSADGKPDAAPPKEPKRVTGASPPPKPPRPSEEG
ncbi:FmdB family zinc ribbon protein [Gemmatimonadota bacterium]